jgi:hypothetical protein
MDDRPEQTGDPLGQASSHGGELRIELDTNHPRRMVAQIDTGAATTDQSVTFEIFDAETKQKLATPTIYPLGGSSRFVVDVPPSVTVLGFRATDTATGKPLGTRFGQFSVRLVAKEQ